MQSVSQFLLEMIAFVILVPTVAFAEIYSPPLHVRDPASPIKSGEADASVPFIYIEPHEACFDINERLMVTIYAVNRSGKPLQVEWPAIVGAISLEPIGPGSAKPLAPRQTIESSNVGERMFTALTVDLKNHFEVKGAAVYRLSYVRSLSDGRIHIASPVSFVVEDMAAINKLTKDLDVADAGDTVAEMLKCNPLFAQGVLPKTYGWDEQNWSELEMRQVRWQTNVAQATARWEQGIERLAAKEGPEGRVRALETVIDRVMYLSDNLRVPLDSRDFYLLTKPIEANLQPQVRERVYLKFARSHDAWVVGQSIGRLMGLECVDRYGEPLTQSVPALDVLFEIADGPDKQLAHAAIGSLSSYRDDPRITQFLRRKMTDSDSALALEAAIVSCYSGDWSGFPVLLRCARSDDPALRMSAIAQLVDHKFQPYSDKVVPRLLAELKRPLSDAHLDRAIESLQTYPTADVVEAVTPLLKHENERVSRRARLTLDTILRERKRNLKNRQDVPLTPSEG